MSEHETIAIRGLVAEMDDTADWLDALAAAIETLRLISNEQLEYRSSLVARIRGRAAVIRALVAR